MDRHSLTHARTCAHTQTRRNSVFHSCWVNQWSAFRSPHRTLLGFLMAISSCQNPTGPHYPYFGCKSAPFAWWSHGLLDFIPINSKHFGQHPGGISFAGMVTPLPFWKYEWPNHHAAGISSPHTPVEKKKGPPNLTSHCSRRGNTQRVESRNRNYQQRNWWTYSVLPTGASYNPSLEPNWPLSDMVIYIYI